MFDSNLFSFPEFRVTCGCRSLEEGPWGGLPSSVLTSYSWALQRRETVSLSKSVHRGLVPFPNCYHWPSSIVSTPKALEQLLALVALGRHTSSHAPQLYSKFSIPVSLQPQFPLPSLASEWDPLSNVGQVRKAQRRGKESPNQMSPFTLYSNAFGYMFTIIHVAEVSCKTDAQKIQSCNVRNYY